MLEQQHVDEQGYEDFKRKIERKKYDGKVSGLDLEQQKYAHDYNRCS